MKIFMYFVAAIHTLLLTKPEVGNCLRNSSIQKTQDCSQCHCDFHYTNLEHSPQHDIRGGYESRDASLVTRLLSSGFKVGLTMPM